MNITLAIVGALLIAIAATRGLMAYNAKLESGQIPSHGDRRVTMRGDTVWIEEYIAYPGWTMLRTAPDIEDAKREVKKWNAKESEKVNVVE